MFEQQSDQELADKLDAQDRLLARGYHRATCIACDGLGLIMLNRVPYSCWSCDGRGFHWQAPITK